MYHLRACAQQNQNSPHQNKDFRNSGSGISLWTLLQKKINETSNAISGTFTLGRLEQKKKKMTSDVHFITP